jgi:hypothetical protein
VAESNKNVSASIQNAKGHQSTWADTLVSTANLAFNAATAISMLGSAFNTLKDPDVSGWEKFVSLFTALAMVIPPIV